MEVRNLILITGGASSGKSSYAEKLALQNQGEVTYIATMPRLSDDAELEAKIQAHKQRRPDNWSTVETTTDVKGKVETLPAGPGTVILDCLSAFVSNLMIEQKSNCEAVVDETKATLAACFKRDDLHFLFVTNEVGSGIVPEHSMSRAYREMLGRANQVVAQSAAQVYLCVSGIPLQIK